MRICLIFLEIFQISLIVWKFTQKWTLVYHVYNLDHVLNSKYLSHKIWLQFVNQWQLLNVIIIKHKQL